jgi:tetratricopeptide (TPR) repeat protein
MSTRSSDMKRQSVKAGIPNFHRALFSLTVAAFFLAQGDLVAQTVEEGRALMQERRFKEARAAFEAVLKKDDRSAEAHLYLGLVFLNRNNPENNVDEAVDQTEKAVELAPNNAECQYGYGAALGTKIRDAGVFKQMILAPKVKKAFQRAVELNPKHVQARLGLAQYYMMAPSIAGGDEQEGWKQVDEVIKLDEVQGRTSKARFLEREKKNEDAENEYRTLLASRSREWRIWKSFGYLEYRIGRYDKSVQCFEKYIELRPDTADSYQSMAEALLKKGEIDRALGYLTKSLDIDKNFVPSIISLGEAYQAKGQKKEAREAYQRAILIAQNEYDKNQAEKKLKEVE